MDTSSGQKSDQISGQTSGQTSGQAFGQTIEKQEAALLGNRDKAAKKSLPADSMQALLVLEHIVEAEEQLRHGASAENPDSVNSSVAKLPPELAADSKVAHAVANQLAGSTALYRNAGKLALRSDIERRAVQVLEKRVEGFRRDAELIGATYAASCDLADEGQLREQLLASLEDLLEKLKLTEHTVSMLLGGSRAKLGVGTQNNASSLLTIFLCEVSRTALEAGAKLLKRYEKQVTEQDHAAIERIIFSGRVAETYSELVSKAQLGKEPCTHVEVLKTALASLALQQCDALLRDSLTERLRVELAGERRLETLRVIAEQQLLVKECCDLLLEGKRVDALQLLEESSAYEKSVHGTFRKLLTEPEWNTSPECFVEELDKVLTCALNGDLHCIVPSKGLSPYDAVSLMKLTQSNSPDGLYENGQVLSTVQAVIKRDAEGGALPTKWIGTDCKNSMTHESDRKTNGCLSKLRLIIHQVLTARAENDSVVEVLDAFCNREAIECNK